MVRTKNTWSVEAKVSIDHGMGISATGAHGKRTLRPSFTEQYHRMKRDETNASRTNPRALKDTLKCAVETKKERNARKASERGEKREASGTLDEAMELFHRAKGMDTDGHKTLYEEAVKESYVRACDGAVHNIMWTNGERDVMQIGNWLEQQVELWVTSENDVDAVVQQVKIASGPGSEGFVNNEIRESIEKPADIVIDDAEHPSEGEHENPSSAVVTKGKAKGRKGGPI